MTYDFLKYQGTGNDFVLMDDRSMNFDTTNQKLIHALCHRRFGIGADGLILIRPDESTDFEMVYFNADGKPGTMCGNGGRCAVMLAWELGIIGENSVLKAPDGNHQARVLENKHVALEMNDIEGINQNSDAWILDTGSPHYVIFSDNVDALDVYTEGQKVRYHKEYSEFGINVNFVQVNDDHNITVRTYERGVEAETYSCGTGVIASAIAAYHSQGLQNSTHKTTVHTKGGQLQADFSVDRQGNVHNVWLTGPATKVFSGVYEG